MAEEEVLAPQASLVPSDHKRKFEGLEPEEPAHNDQHTESEREPDVAASDSSEAKRLRLDDEKPDGLASENGFKEKSDEPVKEEEGQRGLNLNEANEQADNGEHLSEEAPATIKTEQAQGMTDGIEQPSSDNHETGDVLQVENSEADDAQESSKVENKQPSDEDAQQEVDDGSTITRKMEVPNAKVGVLIGKAGDTIRYLQYNSGAKIQIMRDADADRDAPSRPVELIGTLSSILKAEKLINAVIAEADAGGSPSLVARGLASTHAAGDADHVEIQVPNEKVGLIIGRGGETIKGLQTRSGARIQLIPQHLPEGDGSKERTVRVTGDKKQIEMAREMIKDVMNQNVRPSAHTGGFNQQGYRPRGPTGPSQWGLRGNSAQTMPYDYQQRGPYQSQNTHYQHPSYGGYPPQVASRSNYGWEQRPHSMQGPSPQGGGYDYYGRQGGVSAPISTAMPGHGPGPSPAPMGPPPSQSNYNYGQPHAPDYVHQPYTQAAQHSYGHGYEEHKYDNHAPMQHSYGHGSQPGFPQSGPQPGYAPQQQYGKLSSYVMPQAPQQTYGPPAASQPGDMAYQGPSASGQSYGPNIPPQQQYPYVTSGPMQQSYPPYASAPPSDGYNQPMPATGQGYPQQGSQPVPSYNQPAGQQPSGYAQVGAGGYGAYATAQQGYAEQVVQNSAGYGQSYGAPASGQPGYAQPTTQPSFDQAAAQPGSYGAAAGTAPVVYGKTVSPQPGYPQYDSTQMYSAQR